MSIMRIYRYTAKKVCARKFFNMAGGFATPVLQLFQIFSGRDLEKIASNKAANIAKAAANTFASKSKLSNVGAAREREVLGEWVNLPE